MAKKELYQYQKDCYLEWSKVNYRGIATAPTAAGKSLMGIDCLKRYIMDHPQSRCLIVAPSSKVVTQWAKDCKDYNLDVPITTYQKAINQHYRGGLTADCLLLDECHRASPEKQSSAILNLNPTHILGLSATPGGSIQNIGPIFYKVGWDKANVCDFTVHYARYTPDNKEVEQYQKWTKAMQKQANKVAGLKSLAPGRDSTYDFFVLKRRDCCYTFNSRMTHAISLIKTYMGKRMVIFFERNEQIRELSVKLDAMGIKHAICSQIQDNLIDYEEHRCDILLLSKRLREGWSDVTIEVILLIAPTTRALSHTQIVGRALRLNPAKPDKHATIVALIASGTSDENLIYKNEFPPDKTDITTIQAITALAPGKSPTSPQHTSSVLDDYFRLPYTVYNKTIEHFQLTFDPLFWLPKHLIPIYTFITYKTIYID